MMEYKGYAATAEFDDDDEVFHGRVVGLRDVVTFEGQSVEELRREFHGSVDYYLELCAKRGEEPERPYSGKLLLRMSPDTHRRVATAAAREGRSLNAWVTDALDRLAPA